MVNAPALFTAPPAAADPLKSEISLRLRSPPRLTEKSCRSSLPLMLKPAPSMRMTLVIASRSACRTMCSVRVMLSEPSPPAGQSPCALLLLAERIASLSVQLASMRKFAGATVGAGVGVGSGAGVGEGTMSSACTSNAPISHTPFCGRTVPIWSLPRQCALEAASMGRAADAQRMHSWRASQCAQPGRSA